MSNFKPIKKLGQNFLKSDVIASQIADAITSGKEDLIIEIGPGKGVLTFLLAKKKSRIVAIEKDSELVQKLKIEIARSGFNNINLIEADARDVSFSQIAGASSYALAGNIPYYLTSYMFRKVFDEEAHLPARIVFMVQREVAERIIAKNPQHTLLSVSVQVFGAPNVLARVSREYFFPAPQVDSAVLEVSDISRANFAEYKIEQKRFFEILRTGFSQPRKFLINNFSVLDVNKVRLAAIFKKLYLNEKVRAGGLSVKQWFQLASAINQELFLD